MIQIQRSSIQTYHCGRGQSEMDMARQCAARFGLAYPAQVECEHWQTEPPPGRVAIGYSQVRMSDPKSVIHASADAVEII